MFDFRGIELAFDRKPDFLVLEGVKDVRFGDRLVPFVLDPADDGPLLNIEDEDFGIRPIRTVFHLEPDILKELRVPKRLKIAAHRFLGVGVARPREDACEQRIALYAAVPHEFYALDHVRSWVLRLPSPGGRSGREQKKQ